MSPNPYRISSKFSPVLTLVFLFFLSSFSLSAQFVTTWETTTANESITIPINSTETYDYTVDWGDGNTTINETGDATYTYLTAGEQTISITGLFPQIYFSGAVDKDKIISIEQWGNNPWASMRNAFSGCSNLILSPTISNPPNLSSVKDMSGMFYSATSFNQDISNWDVSNVENMKSMFEKATSFNNGNAALTWTSGTGTSKVTKMDFMFDDAAAFNQDISSWDVSLVDNMSYMFRNATAFNNGNAALTWTSGTGTSEVTQMGSMFYVATAFNQDIGSWNVSKVWTMNNMFYQAISFNQNISSWNVSEVTDMTSMFYEATSFNNDNAALTWTSGTGTSEVTGMIYMFRNATSFNQDISSWNVSNVEKMSYMFQDATIFDQNLESWDVTGLTDAPGMFENIALSTENYEKLLISWAAQSVNTGVVFSGGNSTYCSPASVTAHATLKGKWPAITDGGNTGCTPVCSVPASERDALIALYNNLDGANWTNNTNWNTATPVKDWFGVTVDCDNNTVIRIDLNNNKLKGIIPPAIKDLNNLSDLRLYRNEISSTIPDEIWSLTKLTTLELGANKLTGGISTLIKNLTQLSNLTLYQNDLNGELPTELGLLTSLYQINVSDNLLEGQIPNSLINLPNLSRLNFDKNNFHGAIPDFTYLPSIVWFAFDKNNFQFGDFENEFVTYRDISNVFRYSPQAKVDTEITIPKAVGETVDMEVNCSGDNNVYQWYKGTTSLTNGGDISGATSKKLTINNLKASDAGTYYCKVINTVVTDLTIERHDIILTVSAPVCSVPQSERDALMALYNSTDGANWTDNTNWNTAAPVKDWFGVTVDCDNNTVIKIELLSNNLNGASIAGNDIAPKIGDLVNLQILDLENNFLTGNIPTEVGDLTQLTYLDFHNNKLLGDIPTSLNNLTKLEEVFLFTNSLTGNIPNNWGNINSLKRLYIHENQLNGAVPNFSNSLALTHLSIKDNTFQFGDFENDFPTYATNLGSNFEYSPQAKVNTEITLTKTVGQTVDMEVTCSGNNNKYQWYKGTTLLPNGGDISGANSEKLTINNLKVSDDAIYHCKVTNTVVTDLTIERRDVTLEVSATPTNTTDFITKWKTITPNESFTIPTFTGETYNYTIDWGDGTAVTTHNTDVAPSHSYDDANEYTVSISGDFPRIYFNNTGDKDKIISVDQWGDQVWTSMNSAFKGCSKLAVQASSAPNLSIVKDLSSMFFKATSFNQDISNWHVSAVENMRFMFYEASAYNNGNQPLNWGAKTSKVNNMAGMFKLTPFNQDISGWDVSAVRIMNSMFHSATAFNNNNQSLSWGNRTGQVIDMGLMFFKATDFNQDIGDWDVSAVNNMHRMFYAAGKFDQDIGSWITNEVTDMVGMFQEASIFDENIGAWNTVKVTNMYSMFNGAVKFDQNLENWNVESLINTGSFSGAESMFNGVKLLTPNYDALLIGWSAQTLNPGVNFSGGLSQYCSPEAEAARATLEIKWGTITDDGKDPTCGVTAPDCTTLTSPADGTTGVSISTDLTWAEIINAEGYYLSIGTISGGTDFLNSENIVGGATTTYDPSDFEENQIYYVTVIAYNTVGDATSCTETSFTTETIATVPDCTSLTSPADATTGVSISTDLTWTAVTNADGYKISIGTTIGENDVRDNFDVPSGTNYIHPLIWLENTAYFVTVIAYNDSGDATSCLETSFTTEDILATNGPGGVINNNVFWVRADNGISLSGSDIPNWSDQAGANNDAVQPDPSYQPSYTDSDRNYNPGVYFDGTNEHMNINDLIAAGSTNINVFAIGTNETGGDSWHAMVFGQADTPGWTTGGYGITALGSNSNDFEFWVQHWTENQVDGPFIDQPTAILEGKYDGSTIEFFMDAQSKGTDAYSGIIGDNGTTHLGGGQTTSWNHKGYINEVAIYSTDLTPIDRQKINSYFGIKYGITLDRIGIIENYINSIGNSIFSDNGVDTYWNDIIGIGRDDLSTLLQRQSHQNDDLTRLYLSNLTSSNEINTGNFNTDNQFIVIGHNSGLLDVTVTGNNEKPSTISNRIEREWKVTNTNFTETFSIDILLQNIIGSNDELRLLVDSDGDFSDASIYNNSNSLSFNISGNLVTISGISNTQIATNSSSYITIGVVSSATAPICPTVTVPTETQTDVSINPTITWNFESDATDYRISIVRTSDAVEVFNQTVGNVSSHPLVTALDNNTAYSVMVYAINSTGESTGCTAINFTTIALATTPNCPVVTSPTETQTDVSINPTITWNLESDATDYRVSIIRTSDAVEVFNQTVGNVSSHPLVTALENNTAYSVMVYAINSEGESTGCIGINFTTEDDLAPQTTDIPNFFTPNNDGTNDYWQVLDIDNKIEYIQIFDRYGKLLKQFTTTSFGWDGTYMGNPMPSNDYWFILTFYSGNIAKGHFSLIRR